MTFMYLMSANTGNLTKRYLMFPERTAPKCIFDLLQVYVYFGMSIIIAMGHEVIKKGEQPEAEEVLPISKKVKLKAHIKERVN